MNRLPGLESFQLDETHKRFRIGFIDGLTFRMDFEMKAHAHFRECTSSHTKRHTGRRYAQNFRFRAFTIREKTCGLKKRAQQNPPQDHRKNDRDRDAKGEGKSDQPRHRDDEEQKTDRASDAQRAQKMPKHTERIADFIELC